MVTTSDTTMEGTTAVSRRERKALKNLKAEHAAQQKFDAEQAKKAQKAERRAQAKADWEAKSPEEKKTTYKIAGIFVAIVVIIIAIAASCGGNSSKESANTGSVAGSTTTQQQQNNGSGGPEAPKGVEFHTEPGPDGEIVFAKFEIADNLTTGLMRSAAQDETVEILEYARDAYPDASRVFVQGTFDTQDDYGNTNEGTVVLNVGYDRSTLDRINFENVNRSKIWDLRDAGMVNRSLDG